MNDVVTSLAILTVVLPLSSALLLATGRRGTCRRCFHAVGLGAGFVLAYVLFVDSGSHDPGQHPAESKHLAVSWALRFIVVAVGFAAFAGAVGQGLDSVLARARNWAAAPGSLSLPRCPAATVLGSFGLAIGVLVGSIATGGFCGAHCANYARIPECFSLLEAPLQFRLAFTSVTVVAHWWIGTRVGSMIDDRRTR